MEWVKSIIKRILKVMYIIPINNKKIFFMSFDGSAFGFDSKAMVEYIDKNHAGEYEMVWGVEDMRSFSDIKIPGLRFTKIKSLAGICHMMTAANLLYNINPPTYIPFRKSQTLINTWHGFAYKKVGKYAPQYDKYKFNTSTCFISHGDWYTQHVLRDSFEFEGDILNCGAPRNDIFFDTYREEKAKRIKDKLGVLGKHIALFAPTFRGELLYEKSGLDYKKLQSALREKFGGEWVILCRLHPMIAHKFKMDSGNQMDVSDYPDMQELLNASDVLVTDYSSSMWDFGLLRRPVFLYATDIDLYKEDRGFYCPCEEWPFPIARNNKEMENLIHNFDLEEYKKKLDLYYLEMGSFEQGEAAKTIMDYVISRNTAKRE